MRLVMFAKKRITVPVRIDDELDRMIKQEAARMKISAASVIRLAIINAVPDLGDRVWNRRGRNTKGGAQ
jgi:hypothetical protein